MVELLTTMLIIAILGAISVPQFLDFRKEAKVAVLRQNLDALRMGLKNQIQQAMLRCDVTRTPAGLVTPSGQSIYDILRLQMIYSNDITTAYGGVQICDTTQITNPEERKFYILNGTTATSYFNGVAYISGTNFLPNNPLIDPNNAMSIVPAVTTSGWNPASSRCAQIAVNRNNGIQGHWFFTYSNSTDLVIVPGTNTPGVNECNF